MGEAADVVFMGGSVYAPGTEGSRRAGVAVRGGRIAAVGPDDVVRELAGPGTDVVDLAGGLVMPGFQDSHVHPVMGGLAMRQCDLHDTRSADECLQVIAAYAAAHPELEWIVGSGWSMAFFENGTPTRQALDAIVPDRPVYLTNRDGHGDWVNTVALRLAGVDASTPDPADGRIERDADGEPTGALHEGAGALVSRLVPDATAEDLDAALLTAQDLLFSFGITGWQDAAVGPLFGLSDIFPTYVSAARSGALKARVIGALWWERDQGAEQIERHLARRAEGTVGRFAPTSIKIMQDGVAENFTAAMLSPYLDHAGCATDNAGISFVDPEALREHVTRLDAEGFQVHFHALGDRAVREALDAVAAARAANGRTDGRHHLAHLQVVHPDDVPRFAQLDAIANIQPLWAAHEPQMDELTIPFLGEERASWQYPFGDLLRAGARLAGGSDWSVSSANPLEGIHVAVNRVVHGEDAEPLYPRNRITLAEAVTAYTLGSAHVCHRDDSTGRLEPGYLADLAVLDRDIFAAPEDEIAAATVRSTYVEGELVHTTS